MRTQTSGVSQRPAGHFNNLKSLNSEEIENRQKDNKSLLYISVPPWTRDGRCSLKEEETNASLSYSPEKETLYITREGKVDKLCSIEVCTFLRVRTEQQLLRIQFLRYYRLH